MYIIEDNIKKYLYENYRNHQESNTTYFKHSIATHFLNNGMDIRRIQHYLGHRNLASTMIYANIINDEQKVEIKRLHPLNKMKAKSI